MLHEKNFRDGLKELREFLGWSQSDLAKRTGLTIPAISHFENGKRLPSFKNLIKLADAFGVTVDRLIGRDKK